ncbi:MAG: ATP-binding protein [Acidimicrobiales bacterium]
MALPGGTLTFLFTDIAGSTALWEEHSDAMADIVPLHDAVLTEVVEAHGGIVFKTIGDAVCAVFEVVGSAVDAAVEAQQRLSTQPWPGAFGGISVRMGVHTGVARPHGDSDYLGPSLNRVARLVDAGHGGQILLSETSHALIDEGCVDHGRHQLKGLSRPERIFEVRYEGAPVEFPPLRTALAATAGNLPLSHEPLFGRAEELESIAAALATRPLVTLTGPGGVGKTRLSLEAGSRVDERSHRDGIWLIELAPLAADADIYATVASTLSIQTEGRRSLADAVPAALATRDSLLVLDNAEHVLDSVREFARRIVSSCPHIQLLVTSREGLGVTGEQVIRVPPLATDSSEDNPSQPGPSVQLLQHRIALSGAKTDSSAATQEVLAHIARQLDGLPLALELAAARSSVLGLDGLAERLDGQLVVLADRTATEARHETLHATIDWSHELLDETEREVFRHLSVFARGCTLEAAEAVCAPSAGGTPRPGLVLDALDHLASASMIDVELDELGRTRFTMLESLRQYGQLQLDAHDDNTAARQAHADYYRSLAGRTATLIRDVKFEAIAVIDAEVDNFRTACNWGLTTDDPTLFLEIPAVFGWLHYLSGRDEQMAGWLNDALERPSARTSTMFPIALAIAGGMAHRRGDIAKRDGYFERLRSLHRAEDLPSDAIFALTQTDFFEGHGSLDDMEAMLHAGTLDPVDEGHVHMMLSLGYLYQENDRRRATEHATRTLELADMHQLDYPRAWGLYALAEACAPTDPQRARAMLDESIAISERWGWPILNGVARVSLATATMQLGHDAEAARILSDIIQEWHLRGNWVHQWVALRNAVEFLEGGGQSAVAARLNHAIERAPSSPDLFGAQGERLQFLAKSFPERNPDDVLSGDQIASLAIKALDHLATGADRTEATSGPVAGPEAGSEPSSS